MSQTCLHPGCTKGVSSKSLTKCCRMHAHTNVCQCQTCRKARSTRPRLAERDPERIATILVPQPGIYQSEINYAAVSVSRPPWERTTPC